MHQLYTWDLLCSYWPAVYQFLLDVPRRQGFICIWLDVLLALWTASEDIGVCTWAGHLQRLPEHDHFQCWGVGLFQRFRVLLLRQRPVALHGSRWGGVYSGGCVWSGRSAWVSQHKCIILKRGIYFLLRIIWWQRWSWRLYCVYSRCAPRAKVVCGRWELGVQSSFAAGGILRILQTMFFCSRKPSQWIQRQRWRARRRSVKYSDHPVQPLEQNRRRRWRRIWAEFLHCYKQPHGLPWRWACGRRRGSGRHSDERRSGVLRLEPRWLRIRRVAEHGLSGRSWRGRLVRRGRGV